MKKTNCLKLFEFQELFMVTLFFVTSFKNTGKTTSFENNRKLSKYSGNQKIRLQFRNWSSIIFCAVFSFVIGELVLPAFELITEGFRTSCISKIVSL